jgi:hypothetical protein
LQKLLIVVKLLLVASILTQISIVIELIHLAGLERVTQVPLRIGCGESDLLSRGRAVSLSLLPFLALSLSLLSSSLMGLLLLRIRAHIEVVIRVRSSEGLAERVGF